MELVAYDMPRSKRGAVEHLYLVFLHKYSIQTGSKRNFVNDCWNLIQLQNQNNREPFQILETFKLNLQVPFFMEIIILMSWAFQFL